MRDPLAYLDRQTARVRNAAQAAARPARIRFFVRTGIGEARLKSGNRLIFPTHFLEEPTFLYGLTLVRGPVPRGSAPMATAMVSRYQVNDDGMITGAEMVLRVDSAQPKMEVKFSLTFEGVAITAPVGGKDG